MQASSLVSMSSRQQAGPSIKPQGTKDGQGLPARKCLLGCLPEADCAVVKACVVSVSVLPGCPPLQTEGKL